MQQNQREIRETFEIELDNNSTKINTLYIFHCQLLQLCGYVLREITGSHLDPVFLLRPPADLLAHAGPDEQQGGGQRARPRRRQPREAAPRVRVQQRERVLVLQRDPA